MNFFKRTSAFALLGLMLSSLILSGCRSKNWTGATQEEPAVTLTFYGLFDNADIYKPFIESYKKIHPNTSILYKKFTDPEAYLDLIVNELAEGQGPDIFMMQNSWFPKHYKKLTPAPESLVNPEVFRSKFIDVTAEDLIIPDQNGKEEVWGLPLYVDTLALYYNDAHFEDAIPSQGRPSTTWDGIKNDVSALTRQDQSFERFKRAGIAMGRSDNILRAFDVLMTLFLQNKTTLYSADLTKVLMGNDPHALEALNLYTSFGLPSQKNYSWNKYLADPNSGEKELTTFAKGKLSMLMGYSYTYSDLLNEIKRLQAQNETTINPADIKIQELPQMFEPESSAETRSIYANYFVPVVSRTSKNSAIAWDFLSNMVSESNLKAYNTLTHRPSALRSLIKEQTADPIYGVFAAQVGFAHSVPMPDADLFKKFTLQSIDQVLSTNRPEDVIRALSSNLQTLIPSGGVKPTHVVQQKQP